MLWLFGDSILNGFAALAPEDAFPPPADMLNAVFGEERVRIGGQTMLPGGVDKAAARLAAFRTGPGDAIVMLDAGEHGSDPDSHQHRWEQLIRAALSSCARVIVCDAPDNMAEHNWRTRRAKPYYWHALRFGQRSHNDAVRAAAQACSADFLEVAAPMHAFHQAGPGAYIDDNVHLNRLGQAYLCRLVVERVWPEEAEALARLDAMIAGAGR
jgi:hypothetical protein